MNVLLLVPEYTPAPGGIARSAARIAAGLVERGARVLVVAKIQDPDAASAAAPALERPRAGLTVVRIRTALLHAAHWQRELGALYRHLDEHPPQLVHAMGSLSLGQQALVIGQRYGAPVVYGMRGSDVNADALHLVGRFETIARGAHAVTAVSPALAERAIQRCAALRRVTVIPNAVPPAPPRSGAAARRALELSPGLPWIGARLMPRWNKGPARLGRVLARLSRIATGPIGVCLFGAADDGWIADAWHAGGDAQARPFKHLGSVEAARITGVLSGLDLLLMTSHYEGMPNLMLEALAVGTPVAATPAGGCRDVLDGSGAGLLLAWDEATAAEQIAALLASDALPAMRERARAHVLAHYTPQREAAAVYSLYRSLVAPAACDAVAE